jgi:hypothetical protein
MKTFCILFLGLCIACPSFAQSQPDERTPANQIAAFFDSLKKGEVGKAYDELLKGSKIAEKARDVEALKSKTSEAVALFGALQGYETVETKMVGTRLGRFTCISLGEDYPLRWRFYFYRSEAAWRLLDIRVDDRLGEMMGEDAEQPEPPPARKK